MIRLALACAALPMLGACAGSAHYTVEPFFNPGAQRLICCRAEAYSAKDVTSVTFDLSMQPSGSVTVHFTEQGVGATAPIQANTAAISAVAGAVTSAANAAAQFSLKP